MLAAFLVVTSVFRPWQFWLARKPAAPAPPAPAAPAAPAAAAAPAAPAAPAAKPPPKAPPRVCPQLRSDFSSYRSDV